MRSNPLSPGTRARRGVAVARAHPSLPKYVRGEFRENGTPFSAIVRMSRRASSVTSKNAAASKKSCSPVGYSRGANCNANMFSVHSGVVLENHSLGETHRIIPQVYTDTPGVAPLVLVLLGASAKQRDA